MSLPERQNGFTLVEMLVVVAIITLLAALTVPSVQRALIRGQQTQSMNNLRQLVAANLSYAIDHGQYVPASDRWNTGRWHGRRSSTGAPFDPTQGFLAEYLGEDRRVVQCPRFQKMLTGSQSFEEGTGGYGYNGSYIGGWPGRGYDANGLKISARPGQVMNPRTVMFASSAYASGNSIQEYAFSEPPFWDFGQGPTEHRPSPTTHFRFLGSAIVGWADGSVTAVKQAPAPPGINPHGGDADAHDLGWFGPDDENGYWNPMRTSR